LYSRILAVIALVSWLAFNALAAEPSPCPRKQPTPAKNDVPYGSLEEHVIQIDSDGTFLDTQAKADPNKALKRIFDRVIRSGKKRIALYIHGGRVTIGQAVDSACRVGPVIYNDPECSAYPIFICWESGDLSTYLDHLAFERNGVSYKHSSAATLSGLASPLVLGADLGRGISRIPINTLMNFGKLLQNSDLLVGDNKWAFPIKQKFENCLADYLDHSANIREQIKSGFVYPRPLRKDDLLQISLGPDADHYQLKFVAHASITIPLQIASEGLLDAGGTAEWSNMVGRTRAMFHAPRKYLPQEPGSKEPQDGAGTMFFAKLDRFLKDNKAINNDIGLDIYAHSMGSMVTNEAFALFPDLPASNIVFMAAASSIRQFANTTGRHIATYHTPFYNLSLHPRAELDEVEVYGVPVRGSLLTWIDEFFESPASFGDRTLGTFENAIIARDQLPRGSTIHLKAFGIENGDGKKTCRYAGPQKHGDFDQYYFWRYEFREPSEPSMRYCKIPTTPRCRNAEKRK
jgi:hypothetical protein